MQILSSTGNDVRRIPYLCGMPVKENLDGLKSRLPEGVTLVAVTKNQPISRLLELYRAGHRVFGENRVQELLEKKKQLPDDIEWHLIGHLQTNKVKSIAGEVALIHSADSIKLLDELEKQGAAKEKTIRVLLQFHVAQEESKFGFTPESAEEVFGIPFKEKYPHLSICGIMGMGSLTENTEQVKKEFLQLKTLHTQLIKILPQANILSMGMSGDYVLAISCGSTMIRVGSALFV